MPPLRQWPAYIVDFLIGAAKGIPEAVRQWLGR